MISKLCRTNAREYSRMVQKRNKPSPMGKNLLCAFFVGGGICAFGQLLLMLYTFFGAPEEKASAYTSVSLIFLSCLATGLGLYAPLAKIAGAGSLVPITGFANAITAPAIEFKSEGWVTGLAVKMFTIVGPVLVYGLSAGILYGLGCWLFGLFG